MLWQNNNYLLQLRFRLKIALILFKVQVFASNVSLLLHNFAGVETLFLFKCILPMHLSRIIFI